MVRWIKCFFGHRAHHKRDFKGLLSGCPDAGLAFFSCDKCDRRWAASYKEDSTHD